VVQKKYTQSRLCREIVSAAQEFDARGLWRELENDDCFAVIVPGEEHAMYATIMGQAGMEFGLMLFRGENAAQDLVEMLDGDPRDRDTPDEVSFMGFSMSRFAEVPAFARTILKKAKAASRRENIVPFFVAQDPGKRPRGLVPDEVRKLLFVLKGIVKAHEDDLLQPESIFSAEAVQTLVVEGDPLDPELAVEERPNDAMRPSNVFALPEVPGDLREQPRLPGRWLIGCEALPVEIEGDDRMVRMVVVADEKTELILAGEPVQGGTAEAVDVVYDAFRGKNATKSPGIPGEILVAHQGLFDAIAPALETLNVTCRYEPGIPLLERITHELLEHLAEGDLPGAGPAPPEIASMPKEETPENNAPPDHRERAEQAVPMTPELAADLRERMHSHYMGWLDTPIPALGGKTPRETCKTAKGRQKVALMIRTMPKPGGPAGVDIEVPREEMLRELGLE